MTTIVRGSVLERVSVKDFGAVGDGVTDDLTALSASISKQRKVSIPSGDYLFSDELIINGVPYNLEGEGSLISKLLSSSATSYVNLQAVRGQLSDFMIDGANTATYCVYNPVAFAANEVTVSGVHLLDYTTQGLREENADAGRLTGGRIGQPNIAADPGNVDMCCAYLAKDFYIGSHAVLGNSWGKGVICDGSESRITLDSPRINFCYRGFIEARNNSKVNVNGGYFENAAVHKQDNGTNTTNTSETVYAFEADNASLSLADIHCTSGNHTEGVFYVNNGGVISVDGLITLDGSSGGTDPAIFINGGAGEIKVSADFILDDPVNKFSSIVSLTPLTTNYAINCAKFQDVIVYDGTDISDFSANNGALALDAGLSLTKGSSIQFTGNGTNPQNRFSFTFTPRGLQGKLIVVSAVMRATAGAPTNINGGIDLQGAGVSLSSITDGGLLTTAGDWFYHQNGAYITDDTQPIEVRMVLNNSVGANNSADILNVDRIAVTVLDSSAVGLEY